MRNRSEGLLDVPAMVHVTEQIVNNDYPCFFCPPEIRLAMSAEICGTCSHRCGERCQLTGQKTPHQWRHRLGRKLTRNGMPLNLASQLLGHKTVVVTTRYYGTLAIDALQGAMDYYYQDPEK